MQHCVVNQDEDISVTWLLLHNGSTVDYYTCNLVFNARCISSTGAERRLNYFRTVQVGNNETKCFEMFWATSFRFRLIISARFRYSKIVQTFWCIVIFRHKQNGSVRWKANMKQLWREACMGGRQQPVPGHRWASQVDRQPQMRWTPGYPDSTCC